MMENFDYAAAMEQLEKIALKVEDPATGVEQIQQLIKSSDELVGKCREYLRSLRPSKN